MPAQITTLIIGMLPLAELRLAIPMGSSMGLTAFEAYFYGTLGNIIVVVPMVFLFDKIEEALSKRYERCRRFFEKMYKQTHSKHAATFQKLGPLALVLFVSIPLPGTGGWTGALAATVFGIEPRRAWKLITLGIMIAGAVVSIGWESATSLVSHILFQVNLNQ